MPEVASKTVLIIDDDATLRETYQMIFQDKGYTALTAKDGRSGIDAAGEHKPDIIILDLMMPGMNGKEVLAEIKSNAELKSIPVIVSTALIEDLEQVDVKSLGAEAYTVKTQIEPNDLVALVKKVLHKT